MTPREAVVVFDFLRPLLDGAELHVEKLRPLARKDLSGMTKSQLDYYRHYCSALRHLVAICEQKTGVEYHESKRDSGYVD